MNKLAFYYLEFDDGSFCDIQTFKPLCPHALNRGVHVDVVTSHSPWKTERQFIDKSILSLTLLPDNFRDQYIYE